MKNRQKLLDLIFANKKQLQELIACQVHGEFSVEEVLNKFSLLRDERILKSEEYGWVNEEPQVDISV